VKNKQNIASKKTITINELEYENFLKLQEKNQSLEQEIKYLKHQIGELKRAIFGSKSERFIPSDDNQLKLGLAFAEEDVKEPEIEQVTYSRKKTKKEKKAPVRVALPAHLHREEEIIEPEDKQDTDRKIGEVITEILEYLSCYRTERFIE